MMQHTILVIDDQWSMQELARVVLQSAGYRVLLAEDGVTGLSLARTEHPDLIVMDLRMPEMNIADFLQGLRRDRDTTAIPVVLISSDSVEEHLLAGLKAGRMDYLRKPFPPPALLTVVKRALRGSRPKKVAV